MEAVTRPADDDWTAAILERIAAPGAPVAVAALTPLHWTDGSLVDLDTIAPVLRRQGAALVIDATQGAGVLDLDVRRLQPDFLAFPTYKWVLGPYSLGFLYAAPHRQTGRPLEQHGHSRTDGGAFLPGATRYDLGEWRNPILLPIAAEGLETVAGWGHAALSARLRGLTDQIAAAATALGLGMARQRAPHVIGLRRQGGWPDGFAARLARHGVIVAERGGHLRVSPHAYNDAADIARFAEVLAGVLNSPDRLA